MQIVYIRAHMLLTFLGSNAESLVQSLCHIDNIEIHQAQLDNYVQIGHPDHRDHHVHCAIIVPSR